MQIKKHEINEEEATFLKIKIVNGFENFVTIRNVCTFGKSIREAKK